MKLTATQLRKIIAEEITQARAPRAPLPLGPSRSDMARGADERAARNEATWMGYLAKYPKLLASLGRGALLEKLHTREEGAAGGGWSLGKAEVVAAFLEALESAS